MSTDDIWERRAAHLRELVARYDLPDTSLAAIEAREQALKAAGQECTGLTQWLDHLPGYRAGNTERAAEQNGYVTMLIHRGDESPVHAPHNS